MLELPPDIVVGYRTYKFIPMHPGSDPEDKNMGLHNGTWGTLEIDINNQPPYPKVELVNTIMHEVLHAILQTYATNFDEESEEHIVTVVANGLTQLYGDNPDFLTWMVKHCPRDTNEKTSKVL